MKTCVARCSSFAYIFVVSPSSEFPRRQTVTNPWVEGTKGGMTNACWICNDRMIFVRGAYLGTGLQREGGGEGGGVLVQLVLFLCEVVFIAQSVSRTYVANSDFLFLRL